MSRGINKWFGIGNLTADPEMKHLPSGGAVTNYTVACNDSYKDKQSGQMVDKTEFVRCVSFNRLAEVISEYGSKGMKVYVEGRMQTRKWQDQSGQDRYTTEIVVNEFQMLDSRPTEQSGQANSRPAQQQAQGQATPPPADFDDDIPW